MPSHIERLRQHPLLGRLNEEQLARFSQAGELERFEPGEEVVVQGTLGDALYLILSGTATVQTRESRRVLATLGTGEFFGEMSLVEPAARSATVCAAEVIDVFRLPHRAVSNLMRDDPMVVNLLLVALVRVLSDRLRRTNEMVASVAKLSEWLAGATI